MSEKVNIFTSIRIIAILRNRSLKEVMEATGINRQVFYEAEKRQSIETDKLIKIAHELKVKPTFLFNDVYGMLEAFIEKMNSEPSE